MTRLSVCRVSAQRSAHAHDRYMPGDPFTDIEDTGTVDFVMKAATINKRP
ncbi:hypothetical protein [Nocardia cyriacigeorgica]|nr:hypothetical protein [Nocardia cyriacigeorgica]MBF6414010.1 hypothetical protein [Nocardia cyriacigeorgica]